MTTDVSTINTSNFSAMAQAMGMGADMAKQPTKSSTLPRLRIWNKPVMGQVEVKGKMKNMEVEDEILVRPHLKKWTNGWIKKYEFEHPKIIQNHENWRK